MTHEGYKIKIHPDSIDKFKEKVISLAKHHETEKLQQYFTAWITHYRLADLDSFLYDCRQWLGFSQKTQDFLSKLRTKQFGQI